MIKDLIIEYLRIKKQKSVCEIVKDMLKKDIKTIIDVGANKGEFSKAALNVFEQAKVYSFEPIPFLFKDYLLKINNERLKCFMFALSNKNSVSKFNYNLDRKRQSSLLTPSNFNEFKIKKVKIETKRFDSLNLEIKRPCFLKIDVEGAEMLVLNGFEKNLKNIDVLQLEINFSENFNGQAKTSELIKFLEKYNFKRFIQKNIIYEGENKLPKSCDLIFFR